MMVSPFGRIHFCAVLAGKVIAAGCSVGAAFRLTMPNNRAAERKFTTSDLKNVILNEAKKL
jgi:hypothetical protein